MYTEDIISEEEWYDRLRRDSNEVWVVDDGKGIVASLLLVEGRTNLRIEGIQVVRGAQRQGLGGMLLAHAAKRARTRGLGRLTLEVRRDNVGAIELYEKAGFQRFGTIPGYYEDGETAVRMRRGLGWKQ